MWKEQCSLLFVFLLVVPAFSWYTTAPGTSAINKARAFQASLNRAVSQGNERAVNSHISNWMVHDKCQGPEGDKRTFVQGLLAERKLGVVTSARENEHEIYYKINYGYKRQEYMISQHEDSNMGRMVLLCRDLCEGGPHG